MSGRAIELNWRWRIVGASGVEHRYVLVNVLGKIDGRLYLQLIVGLEWRVFLLAV